MNAEKDDSVVRISSAAWIFGLALAACYVGLSHESHYLQFTSDAGIEQGEGLDDRVAFDKNVSAAAIGKRLGFLGVVMLGAAALLTAGGKNRLQFSVLMPIAFALAAVVFGSYFWSDLPSKTFRELFRVGVYCFIGLSFALRFRPQELCLILGMTFAASVGFACTAELLAGNFRPWDGNYRLGGTLHTNVLSNHAAVLAIICFTFYRSSRFRAYLAIIFVCAVLVIILTKTRGALLTTAMGSMASYLIYVWNNDRSAQVGILVGVVGIAVFLGVGGLLFAKSPGFRNIVLLGRAEGAVTLTGRIPLWNLLWKESEGSRALGFGYGAFWHEENLEVTNDELEWYANHAHSSYMHTLLDVGIIGLSMYVLFAIACMRRARNMLATTNNPSYCFFFAYFAAGFVDSLLEVSFVYPRALGLFGLMIAGALMMDPLGFRHSGGGVAESTTEAEPKIAMPV